MVVAAPAFRFARPWVLLAASALATVGRANSPGGIEQLKLLSIDELVNVEITSVSRREETLRDAAAAVAVVTRDDLRRSGAETVPDALRFVPGIHVGQQTASGWAVSSRGFSSVTSEKLLVLSDTRSIYTPLFSGVLWDVQDYLLEDVDRVEVIRGPGAALWGSNAVNGVINITTRSARDTHGSYAELGAGTSERVRAAARYGGETAGGLHFRVFGKYLDRDETPHLDQATDDEWRLGHVGFRTDWDGSEDDSFTVQGDAYSGEVGQLQPSVTIDGRDDNPQGELDTRVSGGNLLARWRRETGEASDLQLRAYYDYTRRDDPSYLDTLHTFDIDLQQRLTPHERHEILWGLSYRLTSNRNRSGGIFAVDPEASDDQLVSGFIQDRIALGTAQLTLGTKLEKNDFSGFEFQPSVRIAWSPQETMTLWSAVSRAVRVPTRLERDIAIEVTPPGADPVARLLGNDEFEAERLVAYEIGYRWRALPNLSFDAALFYDDYDRLASLEIGTPFIGDDGRLIVPIVNENLTAGHAKGAELQVDWAPRDDWRVSASYTWFDMSLTPSGADINRGEWAENATPRNMAGVRSRWTVNDALEIDLQYRYQSRIRRIPVVFTGEGIDSYSEADLRIGWRATDHWELTLLGQNLLHDEHAEFGGIAGRGRLERAAYLKAGWRN